MKSKITMIMLIEAIRKHPCLWNIDSKNYGKRDCRNNAFVIIRKETGLRGLSGLY